MTLAVSNLIIWVSLVLGVACILGSVHLFLNWIEDALVKMADEDSPLPTNVVRFPERRVR